MTDCFKNGVFVPHIGTDEVLVLTALDDITVLTSDPVNAVEVFVTEVTPCNLTIEAPRVNPFRSNWGEDWRGGGKRKKSRPR